MMFRKLVVIIGKDVVLAAAALITVAALMAGSCLVFSDGSGVFADDIVAFADSTVVYDAKDFDDLQARSKSEIMERYTEAMAAGNLYIDEMPESYYKDGKAASTELPYAAGELSSDTLQTMQGMTNFYRWLIGVSDVQVNGDSNASLQAQALDRNFDQNHEIDDANKPADMSDSIWNQGNECDHNILAWGYTPAETVTGWLNEGYDIKSGSWDTVGHRDALLNAEQSEILYGYSGNTAVGKCGDKDNGFNNAFAAFPAAGYMPSNLIEKDNSSWTVELDPDTIRINDKEKVLIEVEDLETGDKYTCDKSNGRADFSDDGRLINFVQPEYTDGDYYTDSYKVTVTGLQDVSSEQPAEVTYTVSFFRMNVLPRMSDIRVKQAYDGGRELRPEVTVGELTAYDDYEVEYYNNTEVGTGIAAAKGIGNYCGVTKSTFTIEESTNDLAQATVNAIGNLIYDPEGTTTKVVVQYFGKTLKENVDYTLGYSNNKLPGTATATVTGIGDYHGTNSDTFKISKQYQVIDAEIESDKIPVGAEVDIRTTVRGGAEVHYKSDAPEIASVDESGKVRGESAGTAKITISADKTDVYYSESKTITVKVSDAYHLFEPDQISPFDDTDKVILKKVCRHCGAVQETLVRKMKSFDLFYWIGNSAATEINQKQLKGTELTVSYENILPEEDQDEQVIILESSDDNVLEVDNRWKTITFKNEGTATLTAYAMTDPEVKCQKTFTVVESGITDISKCKITVDPDTFYMVEGDGPVQPEVTVKDGNKVLIAGEDYVYDYTNNDRPGYGVVIVGGISDYTGITSARFYIEEANGRYYPEKPATCTKEGTREHWEKLGVNYKDPECTERYGNDIKIPALGHDCGEWQKESDTYHIKYCRRCGEDGFAEGEHTWDTVEGRDGEPGDEVKYTCSICGATKTDRIKTIGVRNIRFEPAEDFRYYQNDDVWGSWEPDKNNNYEKYFYYRVELPYHEGDRFIVNDSGTEKIYEYDPESDKFVNGSEQITLYRSNNQTHSYWLPGKENVYRISYGGLTCTIPVYIDKVRSIEFEPAEPYAFLENDKNHGNEITNTPNKYFKYSVELNQEDKLRITTDDGTREYTYDKKDLMGNEVFKDEDGNYVYAEMTDNQDVSHWGPGTHYMTVTCMGVTCRVPVKILEPRHYDEEPAKCEKEGHKEYWVYDWHEFWLTERKYYTYSYGYYHEVDWDELTTEPSGHDYGDWSELDEFQHQRVCSRDASHIEKEDHEWDQGVETRPATETEEGEMLFTCTVCGATKTEKTEKLDHQHKLDKVAGFPETCTEAGRNDYWKCRECGALFSDAAGTKPLASVDDAVIPASGHDYGNWTGLDEIQHQRVCSRDASHIEKENHKWDDGVVNRDATETEPGEKLFTCTVCHATRKEVIPVLGHEHGIVKVDAKPAKCEEDGNAEYYVCSLGSNPCGLYFSDAEGKHQISLSDVVIGALGHDWGAWEKSDASQHQRACSRDASHIEKENHKWDAGVVTKPATETEEGIKTFTCSVCGETKTEAIPKKEKVDPVTQKGSDGTALGKGASSVAADIAITGMKSDSDPAGSKIFPMLLKSSKQAKTSIKLSWARPAGAVRFVVYGNMCGKKNKMTFLGAYTNTSVTVKKAPKKIVKGKYYKFIVVALDKNSNVVATSKVIHAATKGGKVGNFKSVKTKAKKNKVTVKKSKTFKLAAKGTPASKKLKVKKHSAIRYESANAKVATVTGKGVIKGVKKGTTYVYAYSQSGTFAKIKVTVK